MKKFKTLLNIYKEDGLDGVIYNILKKIGFKVRFPNILQKKRYLLGQKIAKKFNNTIFYGPYKGTVLLNDIAWSSNDLSSKYIGLYEIQIQKKIIELKDKFDLKYFVNLGAGDGFHIIGLLKKNYFQKGYAFEKDENSRILIKKNAKLNQLEDNLKIFGEANENFIEEYLKDLNLSQTLFLIDIEGAEYKIFNDKVFKKLSFSHMIFENHDKFSFINQNYIKNFNQIIKQNFNSEIIKTGSRDPGNFAEFDNFSDNDRWLMMSEGRRWNMTWQIVSPKNI